MPSLLQDTPLGSPGVAPPPSCLSCPLNHGAQPQGHLHQEVPSCHSHMGLSLPEAPGCPPLGQSSGPAPYIFHLPCGLGLPMLSADELLSAGSL